MWWGDGLPSRGEWRGKRDKTQHTQVHNCRPLQIASCVLCIRCLLQHFGLVCSCSFASFIIGVCQCCGHCACLESNLLMRGPKGARPQAAVVVGVVGARRTGCWGCWIASQQRVGCQRHQQSVVVATGVVGRVVGLVVIVVVVVAWRRFVVSNSSHSPPPAPPLQLQGVQW